MPRCHPSRRFISSRRAGSLAHRSSDELSPEEWAAPTICPGWSVKDVAGHLLGDDLGRLSGGRDDYDNPDFGAGLDIATLPGLIAAIDRQNALWVAGDAAASAPGC